MPIDIAPRAAPMPVLLSNIEPPVILGTAALASQAFAGAPLAALLDAIRRASAHPSAMAFDQGLVMQMFSQSEPGLAMQAAALARSSVFRIRATEAGRLRILAFCAPGDLMTNTPLEFLATGAGVRLDLVFVNPNKPLPEFLPDHDIAFCAVSEMAPEVLSRLTPWLAAWPRRVLNKPPAAGRLAREIVAPLLAGIEGLLVPQADCLDPETLLGTPEGWFPMLVRPAGTHAGRGLTLVRDRPALGLAVTELAAERYHRTRFVDYRSSDGLYRKYRVALVAGRPLLCHMAISDHWMVHYLNAGMALHAERRAEEASALEEFEIGFGRRHREVFAAMSKRLDLDWVVVDCAEAPDGRLLFFEADVAAIVHDMDPPELYPYKRAAIARVFEAFSAMINTAA